MVFDYKMRDGVVEHSNAFVRQNLHARVAMLQQATLFDLLDARRHAGIELTSSFAMNPPASVSGLYFSHPEAVYFAVGRIEKDQVEDYARRKGWDLETAERWLRPILNY